jgi:spore germination cell wall hydrolase CwlJ-like protein
MLKASTLAPAYTEAAWISQKDLKCLADNIYFEARGEPLRGRFAVARVTLNRAADRSKSICEVVYEKHQFSWTAKKGLHKIYESEAYKQAVEIAYSSRLFHEPFYYFHSIKVSPYWAKHFPKLERINNHVFYSKPYTK